jgi:hypothetical protein
VRKSAVFGFNVMVARLDGKPLTSERWLVQATGQVVKTVL